jgi:hypothetical protein
MHDVCEIDFARLLACLLACSLPSRSLAHTFACSEKFTQSAQPPPQPAAVAPAAAADNKDQKENVAVLVAPAAPVQNYGAMG